MRDAEGGFPGDDVGQSGVHLSRGDCVRVCWKGAKFQGAWTTIANCWGNIFRRRGTTGKGKEIAKYAWSMEGIRKLRRYLERLFGFMFFKTEKENSAISNLDFKGKGESLETRELIE